MVIGVQVFTGECESGPHAAAAIAQDSANRWLSDRQWTGADGRSAYYVSTSVDRVNGKWVFVLSLSGPLPTVTPTVGETEPGTSEALAA